MKAYPHHQRREAHPFQAGVEVVIRPYRLDGRKAEPERMGRVSIVQANGHFYLEGSRLAHWVAKDGCPSNLVVPFVGHPDPEPLNMNPARYVVLMPSDLPAYVAQLRPQRAA